MLRLREKEIDSLKNEQDHKKQVQVLENKIKQLESRLEREIRSGNDLSRFLANMGKENQRVDKHFSTENTSVNH